MDFELFERMNTEKHDSIINTGISIFAQRPYSEAGTDYITKSAGISKGLLFHYFGSKKNYYIYCLKQSLNRLMIPSEGDRTGDFYDVLFSFMQDKIEICNRFPNEMHFVNMASRENSSEILEERNRVFQSFQKVKSSESFSILSKAITTFSIKEEFADKAVEAIQLYSNVIVNKYLGIYQQNPDLFFQNADVIKVDIRAYLDMLLYGIIER